MNETREIKCPLCGAPAIVTITENGKKYRTRKKNINRALRDYERKRRQEEKT